MKLSHAIPLVAAIISGMSIAADPTKKTWDFEKDEPGRLAKGFTNDVGQWEVAKDGDNHVLYQKAKNDDATFNVALVEGTSCKDIDLSVKLKAVAGEVDRGGGLVWRAKDSKNYYLARYNPLEDNFRVYKVQDGKRTQFQSARRECRFSDTSRGNTGHKEPKGRRGRPSSASVIGHKRRPSPTLTRTPKADSRACPNTTVPVGPSAVRRPPLKRIARGKKSTAGRRSCKAARMVWPS